MSPYIFPKHVYIFDVNSIRQLFAIFLLFNISSYKSVCSFKLIEVGVAYYSGYLNSIKASTKHSLSLLIWAKSQSPQTLIFRLWTEFSVNRSCPKFCTNFSWGSGCDSVGRAVASEFRGPQFESGHRQIFCFQHIYCNWIEKTKVNTKVAGNGIFYKFAHTCWFETFNSLD